jgi:hypothetical protein
MLESRGALKLEKTGIEGYYFQYEKANIAISKLGSPMTRPSLSGFTSLLARFSMFPSHQLTRVN